MAIIGAMISAALSMPAAIYAQQPGQLMMLGETAAPPRNRARRRALVASGYSIKRSKGAQARRKAKVNRLHVSRRVRRRHRRQRRAA